ncbi:MAG: response regulator transcription factor [Pseudomonadota bacterium]
MPWPLICAWLQPFGGLGENFQGARVMAEAQDIRIVMADDHLMFRQGLGRMLEAQDGLSIAGECANGDDLLKLVEALDPDVAIVDISMPGPGPAGIVDAMEERGDRARALALTMHLEPSYARELLAHGMCGYVVKEAAFDELIDAIHAVAEGDQYLCNALIDRAEAETPLTERELECLTLAARGQTAKMIARELDISERTVRFHVSNFCRKLSVQRRTEAVAEALRLGLIEV